MIAPSDSRPFLLAVAASILAAGGALAQSPTTTVTVTGIVVGTSGRAIPDAEVSLPILKLITHSDSAGAFRFVDIPKGEYFLRARHVGFRPADLRVQLSSSSPQRVEMTPIDVLLDTVVVREKCPGRGFAGFTCRQKAGAGGVFLDYISIDSSKADQVADLFFDRPGFRVQVHANGIKYLVATTGWQCLVTLVNGLPVSLTNRMPIRAEETVAVEIYEHDAAVPKAYEQYSWRGLKRCGLVIYWTNSR